MATGHVLGIWVPRSGSWYIVWGRWSPKRAIVPDSRDLGPHNCAVWLFLGTHVPRNRHLHMFWGPMSPKWAPTAISGDQSPQNQPQYHILGTWVPKTYVCVCVLHSLASHNQACILSPAARSITSSTRLHRPRSRVPPPRLLLRAV